MSLVTAKYFAALSILIVTLLAGVYPLTKKLKNQVREFPLAEALAAGVFLGAGLIHMLADANAGFTKLGIDYPVGFFIAGCVFLFLLWLEHLGREYYEHQGRNSARFALLATILLAIHSFFTGAALGIATHISIFVMIMIAIFAHKWVASFALAVQISTSDVSAKRGIYYFAIFSLMAPLGVLFGNAIDQSMMHLQFLQPTFNALAAGTFIYLGTLHGLERATMIEKCCNLKHFSYVILGFLLMAIIALWT